MFFLRSSGPSPLSPSDGMHAQMMVNPQLLVCPPMLWQAQPSVESWQAIYRMAYEQFVMAIAPSPFQRALEPSRN